MLVTPERNRANLRFAWAAGVVTAGLLFSAAFSVAPTGPWRVSLSLASLPAGFAVFRVARHRTLRRLRVASRPFPSELEEIFEHRVAYYRGLDANERDRFRRMAAVFLDEVRITGIRTDVDDETRALVAASAVIPVFGFHAWEYERLGEVLIYPGSFDREFRTEGVPDRDILGMVGTGNLSGVMILSKPDLRSGFADDRDRRNVGIHEFAHLVDRGDGSIDGLPPGMRASLQPFVAEVHAILSKERRADDIDPYGFTNEIELFAVLAEYFFEAPDRLERNHPEIFRSLERLFSQDPRGTLRRARRHLGGARRKRVGRNAPCPCGSGEKFKRCCGSVRKRRRKAG